MFPRHTRVRLEVFFFSLKPAEKKKTQSSYICLAYFFFSLSLDPTSLYKTRYVAESFMLWDVFVLIAALVWTTFVGTVCFFLGIQSARKNILDSTSEQSRKHAKRRMRRRAAPEQAPASIVVSAAVVAATTTTTTIDYSKYFKDR